MKLSTRLAFALGLGLALAAGAANAAEHQVKMLNRGAKGMMVFEPDLIKIAPGDTVTFVAVNPGHDARSIKGMIPEGAEPFEGKISKDVSVTFTQPGVYGVECRPHYAMGMVAAVVVGDPVNLDAAKAVKQPPMAKKKFDKILGGL
jgi:pseudoazurin